MSTIGPSGAAGASAAPEAVVAVAVGQMGVEPRDAGTAGSLDNVSQQLGSVIGVALISTFVATATSHYLTRHPDRRTDRGANRHNTNHNRQKGEFTMPKLDGKVAVITGATSGMALATAKLFAAEGAHVFITGRRKDKLDEAVAAIGHNVTGVQADSGNLDDLARLAETVQEHHGRVDVRS